MIERSAGEAMKEGQLERKIKTLLLLFICGLIVSGITAFPLLTELEYATSLLKPLGQNRLVVWIEQVSFGVQDSYSRYPFIAYGTDWLAFAHLVIAIAFIGPLRDPVRNIWVIEFGLIACAGIFPLAFIAGSIRGIPIFWQLIDCSFGLIGGLILWTCYRMIKKLESRRALEHGYLQ